MEEAMAFYERVDTLARVISEDCEAMIIAIKRQDEAHMTPIIVKSGDPFAINGLAEFVARGCSDDLQYQFSEYYVVEDGEDEG